MTGFNIKHYLDEFRENIRLRDKIKAGILADHFTELRPNVKKRVLFELSRAEDDFSIPLIFKLYQTDSMDRNEHEQIKELLFKKIQDFPFALLEILQDENVKEKNLFIEWAGVVRCNNAVPVILNHLRNNSELKDTETCLLALGKIGNTKAVNEIADYLYSGNRQLTLAAIQALQDMATPEAVRRLAERLGTDFELDMRILKALAAIRDHYSLEIINKQLLAHNAKLRNCSISALTEIGAMAIPFLVDNLAEDNVDLLIHSLTILGNIGEQEAAPAIRKLLFNEPEDANVRFAAYEALGKLSVKSGAYVLTEGLVDPEEQVRIAAAKALEMNMDKTVLAGIRNLLKNDDEAARKITVAFLNAEAENIFISLLDVEVFQKNAISYLAREAHPDIRVFYEKILVQHHKTEWLKKIAPEKGENEMVKPLIFAVDDSRMILKVYKSTLHQLGYAMELFEFPESALEELQRQKPALLITDLNMPVMNGVELTAAIRNRFSKEKLPILMVTTQQDLADREAAYAAGINGIVYKPFTEDSLEKEIRKMLAKA